LRQPEDVSFRVDDLASAPRTNENPNTEGFEPRPRVLDVRHGEHQLDRIPFS
jgi:hypothetical protein